MIQADVAIVGAGMAGASLAAELAGSRSVVLLEAEPHPGRHATGRSAAFWTETYGGSLIQPLTTASGPFLRAPPPDFSPTGFLRDRGAVHLARDDATARLDAFGRGFAGSPVALFPRTTDALCAAIPGLRAEWTHGLAEPSCADIDVAALHAAYLRAFARGGGRLLTDAPVTAAARTPSGWRVTAGGDTIACAVLVDAAGAWADDLARLAGVRPLGLRAYRRTIVQLRVDPPAPAELPLVIDVSGGFYFKGEAGGRLWLSPHDETPSAPGDAAPEELDIALAIDRLQQVVDWRIVRVERSWAGLRTFSPDRLPVYGYDPAEPSFFWCAGQGGFGIQTAPAAAKLAAAMLRDDAPDPMLAGIDPRAYRPDRFDDREAQR